MTEFLGTTVGDSLPLYSFICLLLMCPTVNTSVWDFPRVYWTFRGTSSAINLTRNFVHIFKRWIPFFQRSIFFTVSVPASSNFPIQGPPTKRPGVVGHPFLHQCNSQWPKNSNGCFTGSTKRYSGVRCKWRQCIVLSSTGKGSKTLEVVGKRWKDEHTGIRSMYWRDSELKE